MPTRCPGSSASKPTRAIVTNMHADLDYALRADLPPHVVPAHDGMRVEVG